MILSAYNEGKKTLFVGVIDARARGEGEKQAPAGTEIVHNHFVSRNYNLLSTHLSFSTLSLVMVCFW